MKIIQILSPVGTTFHCSLLGLADNGALCELGTDNKWQEIVPGVNTATAEQRTEGLSDAPAIPPISLEKATSWAETVMIAADKVESWWLARDAVGWLRNGHPIARWQSDLQGYARAWQQNEAQKPSKTQDLFKDSAQVRLEILQGKREPYANRSQRPWNSRVGESQQGRPWAKLKDVTRARIVREMELEGINVVA